MRVAFTGDRNWQERELVKRVIESFPEDTEFILGDARGLDRMARELCEELGRKHVVEQAYWNKYGKYAGPERNERMLAHLEEGDIVIGFHDNLKASRGTRNCLDQAVKLNLEVRLINSDA